MGKVLIVYATRADETKTIADLIGEGIRIAGHEAVVKRITEIFYSCSYNDFTI